MRGCGYEMHDAAAGLYRSLCAEFEADPAAFFARVRGRRDELRAAEPVWRR